MGWPRIFLLFLCVAARGQQDFSAQFERIKAKATARQLYALLYELPKGGDLHHHGSLAAYPEEWLAAATNPQVLKGNRFYTRLRFLACPDSVEPFLRFHTIARFQWQQLSECAKAEYIALQEMSEPQRLEWLSAMRLDRRGEGREEFFERIVARLAALGRDPHVLLEVMARYVLRYSHEGLAYLETQFNPRNAVDERGQPVPVDEYVRLLRQTLERRELKSSGVTLRFLYPVIRFHPEAEKMVESAYAFVAQNRDLWVGLNLVGREDNDKGHALRFLDVFRAMRRKYSGVHLSIHGGEVDSPGREVRNTLLLGAERIGHGFNLITDPDTLLLLRHGRNLIEVCLVSNYLLEYVDHFARHPFVEYLRLGIPVSLNTDDPGVWESNLTDEYFLALRHFHLSWSEVVEVGLNSLEHAFLEPALKAQLIARYKSRIRAFEAKYSAPDWETKLNAVQPSISGFARRHLLVGAD
ncbi:MAG: hypothetical protein NZV14_06890 [Bryobacteraceae bacterium]|nr:hypothetical protein [Bryobacteraceae bacterium]MDW8377868.1 hypothetical protein [Bryobacterales bacterium]